MANVMLIVFMVLSMLPLFTAMILSSIAADKSKDAKVDSSDKSAYGGTCTASAQVKCHKNSMYSALVTGISVAVLLVVLIIYIYTTRGELVTQAHQFVGQYVPQQAAAK